MIISKAQMNVVLATTKDKQLPVLDNVHVRIDGTTIAASRNAVIAVSPVSGKVTEALPLKAEGVIEEGITVSSETIKHLLAFIPKDTLFSGRLEFMDVSGNETECFFRTHDGKRKRQIDGKVYNGKYIPYRDILGKVITERENATRIVLNRKRLILLLSALDKCAEDESGEAGVFIEICPSGSVILRAANTKTGQRVLAVMSQAKTENWPEPDEWESSLRKTAKKAVMK